MSDLTYSGRCEEHLSPRPCLACWNKDRKPAPFKINAERTAAVAPDVHWIPVGPDTPRGVGMWLINKASGVSQKGQYASGEKFFDHWFPNPTFKKD